ncbi:glycosyltransferase family 2 protein [Candidatus Sumerlaeota bacterium]|nr:glycosyltransferase family 2 protein [Candidatus Sumerlaeota bacterium]
MKQSPEHRSLYWKIKYLVNFKWRIYQLRRWMGLLNERLFLKNPEQSLRFHIVSCQRNASEAVIKCLDSVYQQNYPRNLVRHVLIDDESSNDTPQQISEWLASHADHSVMYFRTSKRQGGCANTLRAFRLGRPDEIFIELNGDDWLPDDRVLDFYNRVYGDPNVWLTYNTTIYADGSPYVLSRPYAKAIIRNNDFRQRVWHCGHPHTFRGALFSHLDEWRMIDEEIGDYWERADDMACYAALHELAGAHQRHIYRTSYVQNVRAYSEVNVDPGGQERRWERIKKQKPCVPLPELSQGECQPLNCSSDAAGMVPDIYQRPSYKQQ